MHCTNCYGKGQRENWRYPATDNFGDSDGEEPEFLGYVKCEECGGTGKTPEDKLIPCPVCHGRDTIILNGLNVDSQPIRWTNFRCPACSGEGLVRKGFNFEHGPNIIDESRKKYELKILLIKLFGGAIKP